MKSNLSPTQHHDMEFFSLTTTVTVCVFAAFKAFGSKNKNCFVSGQQVAFL